MIRYKDKVGHTLIEVALIVSLIGVVLFLAYFALNSSVEGVISADGSLTQETSPMDE